MFRWIINAEWAADGDVPTRHGGAFRDVVNIELVEELLPGKHWLEKPEAHHCGPGFPYIH